MYAGCSYTKSQHIVWSHCFQHLVVTLLFIQELEELWNPFGIDVFLACLGVLDKELVLEDHLDGFINGLGDDFNVYKKDRNEFIECMERQHDYKPVQCDPVRAVVIKEAQLAAGNDLPTIFHFFNPDRYDVDGVLAKFPYEKRVDALVKDLDAEEKPDLPPLTIKYWFYNTRKGQPVVLSDADYPQEVKPCVKYFC